MGTVEKVVRAARQDIELPGPRAREILAIEARSLNPGVTRKTGLVWGSASGSVITDVDGNEFLDFGSGILITNVGHSHPHVTAAVAEAAARSLTFYNFPSAPRALLSKRLTALMPGGITRAAFYSGGAEAIDAAVRMARAASGRTEILGFSGGFHGRTYMPMTVGGLANTRRGFGPFVGGVTHAPFPTASRDTGKDWRTPIEEVVGSLPAKSIAAFVVEPFQGAGGVVVPPDGFLPYLRELCDRIGALLILDEVQSGYGRSGPMFASELSGVRPDLVVLGKCMANGFPMSAVMTTEEVGGSFGEERFSSTFGGNPVACAAALAVLDVFETENVLDHGRRLAAQFAADLADWKRDSAQVGEIRQLGMAIGVEVVDPHDGKPDPATARRAVDVALRHGLVINLPIGTYKNVIRIGPAVNMPFDEAAEATKRLRAVVAEARAS
jgi:4-aminobutyrate aminotransferase / (S)-3-amino-2-methylpropionate transaminase / 5-aminovalerate transaminase